MPNDPVVQQFVDTLWPSLPEGQWLLFWGAPSKKSVFAQREIPDLSEWAGRDNVYIGCALRSQKLVSSVRGGRDDCTAIPGLWLDIDYGTEHKKPHLPPTQDAAHGLINALGLRPTVLIHSGRGLQAWWCFREPLMLTSEEDRREAETLTKGWNSLLRAKAREQGWDADATWDLSRVMRVPGTWNRKGVPLPTRLLLCDPDTRYNLDDFRALIPDESETDHGVKDDIKWEFTIDPLHAEPPASKFLLLSEINSSFKLGWFEKLGLQDQSPSAYDLSQASIAFAANWSPQEIVNLLIARRRLHKHDIKVHRRYYELTLTKAASDRAKESRKQVVEDFKAGKSVPDEVAKDPAEALAVCSSFIGVDISKFVRFKGEPNTYRLTVNGHAINIPSVDHIESQAQFRRLLVDHSDYRFETMKSDKWNNFVNLLFSAIENVQLSHDSTVLGSYENWVELHLADGVSEETDWEKAAVNNTPFKKDAKIHFVAEGFRRYVYGCFQEKITAQQMTAALTKIGFLYKRFNVRTKQGKMTKRSVWQCPDSYV